MSRIRSTHPGIWTDERFVGVSAFARLLFMGLWNECDDFGSFEWSPLKLKMRLLPADGVDAAALLAELESEGSVMKYEIDGRTYGAVRNFCQYQRPKKPTSSYPQTDEVRDFVNTEARSTRDGSEPVGNQSGTGGEKCRQRKEEGDKREKKEVTAPKSAAPLVFEGRVVRLNALDYRNWERAYPLVDLRAALQTRDDWLATEADPPTRKKWFIATSNWLLAQQQRAVAESKRVAEAEEMPC